MTENIATIDDYAKINFTPQMTKQDAEVFGGERLSHECITMRVGAYTLTKSKDELVESFSKDGDVLEETIQMLIEQEEFLKALVKMNEQASLRLMSVAATLTQEHSQ